MKIETTFEIGQSVFYMHQNCVVENTINKISIEIEKDFGVIKYHFPLIYNDSDFYVIQNRIFSTKEELIKSL